MKIYKINGNDCGGFQKPKGHLDTQLFPECNNTETDRNVVKKTIKRRKKHACNIFNLKKYSQRSRFTDLSTIEGPDMKELTPTKLQMIKYKLEEKYPKINWTIEKVMEWVNNNLLHKITPLDRPKDLYHGD